MLKSLIISTVATLINAREGPFHVQCMPFPKTRHQAMAQVDDDFKWDAKEYL